ncbi:type II secretion system protein F [Kurthia zopfii]|uniref:Cholera toxin secretion protein epsF n=1 Tax=Kurthia zopfii TaxID=1650 RepID=A0A8B4QBU2_9BACL|nr:type II secretion system F family protein [Kurthia zopfii]PWI23998.1 type II secretion system F family protein [Kurthia zopfii]TDR44250.1 type IV pilus assembly protein PilC [Kurthia zopfii]GEK29795.1 type II secretion system protein F [Kurthia zopfii]STX10144.1 Cholera toxin secretion protein epsF [Kurthia zopfii]
MTTFKYIGRSKKGEQAKGTVEADSKSAAIKKIKEMGISPREITESNSILHMDLNFGAAVKMEHFVIFCRQFATLIRAGVSIVESVHILAKQTESKMLKKSLFAIEEDLRAGISFSTAASKFPKVFPTLFINMMKAGEVTGNMDETLERLASSYEKTFKLKKKIQSAMMYPIVLIILILFVGAFMLLWLVPQFTQNFESFGAELPTITVIVLKFSDALKDYWWIFLSVIIAVVGIFIFLFKNNKQFHYSVYYVLLKLPVFGAVLQKSAIARMTRTLSSLFSSSVPILNALTIVEKISGNPIIEEVIRDSKKSLEAGSSLADPLEKSWVFPPLVTQMVSIGETTGSLDYMLEKIAEFYEDDVDRTVDSLKSLIEPLMILLLAGIVGFIVAAIMMPMFSLYDQI